MIHSSRSVELFQWSVIPFAASALLAAGTLPLMAVSAQAQVIDYNYAECADELLAVGVDDDAAAIACGTAYQPTEVADCVSGVLSAASVTTEAALSACSRDRRPDEVSTCVADIHTDLVVDDSTAVLDHCHRTILPERYAACVTGIAAEIGYTTDEALASCIAAGYRPVNVTPTYIPMD
ncbi:MAG: hypothetical protein ACFBSG_12595 [Leptolyngbyaceae cyanobacterium]